MSSKAQSAPKSLVIISSALVLVWIVLASFPFVWTLWGSFKVQGDFFSKADWRYALTGTRTIIETGLQNPPTPQGTFGVLEVVLLF